MGQVEQAMKETIRQNENTTRSHYNSLFTLLDREKSYAEDWTKRPPIVNLGYWADGARTARDAQIAFVHHLASLLPDLKGRRVLDVGCGLAGPAVILAADYGAKVDCININETQVQWARRFVEGNGLKDRIRIHVGTSMDIPFRDEFDTVFCLESAHCYIDKTGFLAGTRRALRTGGRLLLADITGTTHFTPLAYQPALKLSLITAKDWQLMIEAAGFSLEKNQSVRKAVYPGYRRWLKGSAPERRARIVNKISPKRASGIQQCMRNVQAWALELALCRSVLPIFSWLNLRDYTVILARKD